MGTLDWKRVLRDAILIMLLTALGGLVIGIIDATGGGKPSMLALGITNIALSIVGFAISGSLTRKHRARHLLTVGILVWLLSLVNLAMGASLVQWLTSSIAMLFACGVGGAISALLFPATKEPPIAVRE